MIRIRRKKADRAEREESSPAADWPTIEPDAQYVGAFPGKPWERLTDRRHRRGSRLKALSPEEQEEVVRIARWYFGFEGSLFAAARACIQRALDDPRAEAPARFFAAANFAEKCIVIRAYLSDADGRFIAHEAALPLLIHIAQAGLDFEVGAIDHVVENVRKTEFVIGDGTEVASDMGWWFAHTHPVKRGVVSNVLPSMADIDVMVATARSIAHAVRETRTISYVLRDIGGTRVTIMTSVGERPSSAVVERVEIDYWHDVDDDGSIAAHAAAVARHLRMRHRLAPENVIIRRVASLDELIGTAP